MNDSGASQPPLVSRRNALIGTAIAALAAEVAHGGVLAPPTRATGKGAGRAHRIVRDIKRPDPALIEKIVKGPFYPVAFAGPLTLGTDRALTPAIAPIRQGIPILGPAFTVQADDHLMPMYATELAQPGDILVIDAGNAEYGMWGGSMTKSAQNRKLGGIVINGRICDSGALRKGSNPRSMTPIYCRGSSPSYTTWERPGSINVPIMIEGLLIEPGDIIIGGDDGLAVIPRDQFPAAVEKAMEFLKMVPKWHGPMDAGKTWFQVLGLQATIDRLQIPETKGPI